MFAAMRVDYHRYRALAVPLVALVVVLLVIVLVPGIGVRAGGAARWLRAGAVGLQPAELAKLALIIYLAAWLGSRRGGDRKPPGARPGFRGGPPLPGRFCARPRPRPPPRPPRAPAP